jgi:hypothetical protein
MIDRLLKKIKEYKRTKRRSTKKKHTCKTTPAKKQYLETDS